MARLRTGMSVLAGIGVAGAATVQVGALTTDDLEIDSVASMAIIDLTARACVFPPAVEACWSSAARWTRGRSVSRERGPTARALVIRIATVRIDGTAHAVLRVAETLDVSIDGTAVVEYAGDPVLTQEIDGVGVVRRTGP